MQAYGLVGQFFQAKQANRNLKVLLAFGGWGGGEKWAPTMHDPKKRANFVATAVKLILDYGMDGIDVDWEYPDTEESAGDAASLLKELRTALDGASERANGYHFTLSIASPADPKKYKCFDFKAMNAALDFWSIMAYSYAGAWDETAGHQANLFLSKDNPEAVKFNTHQVIVDYTNAGVEEHKINLGLPLYGHIFQNTDGLGKSFEGPKGDDSVIPIKKLPHSESADTFYDKEAMAQYTYDHAARELVSYDDEKSIDTKLEYIFWVRLGGAMFWEASQDRPGESSIIKRVAKQFDVYGELEKSENNLIYPDSQYSNIKAPSDS